MGLVQSKDALPSPRCVLDEPLHVPVLPVGESAPEELPHQGQQAAAEHQGVRLSSSKFLSLGGRGADGLVCGPETGGELVLAVYERVHCSALASVASAASNGIADDVHPGVAQDPEKPTYHVMPSSGWINDPNGPFYYNGKYHL